MSHTFLGKSDTCLGRIPALVLPFSIKKASLLYRQGRVCLSFIHSCILYTVLQTKAPNVWWSLKPKPYLLKSCCCAREVKTSRTSVEYLVLSQPNSLWRTISRNDTKLPVSTLYLLECQSNQIVSHLLITIEMVSIHLIFDEF